MATLQRQLQSRTRIRDITKSSNASATRGLLSLADELLDLIASYLPHLGDENPKFHTVDWKPILRRGDDGWFSRVQDLKNLGLSNRRLSVIVKPRLFGSIILGRSDWYSLDVQALLKQPQLHPLIRHLRINLFFDEEDQTNSEDDEETDEEASDKPPRDRIRHQELFARLIQACADLETLVVTVLPYRKVDEVNERQLAIHTDADNDLLGNDYYESPALATTLVTSVSGLPKLRVLKLLGTHLLGYYGDYESTSSFIYVLAPDTLPSLLAARETTIWNWHRFVSNIVPRLRHLSTVPVIKEPSQEDGPATPDILEKALQDLSFTVKERAALPLESLRLLDVHNAFYRPDESAAMCFLHWLSPSLRMRSLSLLGLVPWGLWTEKEMINFAMPALITSLHLGFDESHIWNEFDRKHFISSVAGRFPLLERLTLTDFLELEDIHRSTNVPNRHTAFLYKLQREEGRELTGEQLMDEMGWVHEWIEGWLGPLNPKLTHIRFESTTFNRVIVFDKVHWGPPPRLLYDESEEWDSWDPEIKIDRMHHCLYQRTYY